MLLTVRSWDGSKKSIRPVVKNLPAGTYLVKVGAEEARREKLGSGDELALDVEVGGEEVDVVVRLRHSLDMMS